MLWHIMVAIELAISWETIFGLHAYARLWTWLKKMTELLNWAAIHALASFQVPIVVVTVKHEVMGSLETQCDVLLMLWSANWVSAQSLMLSWHTREIWVSKPNTNQHGEPIAWLSIFDKL